MPTATPGPPPAPEQPRALGYEPGLDGLRAVALLAIILVHVDVGLAPGGFLAVSTFFTLSGFLITALLTMEHAGSGRIDLRRFWARRARRLLPLAVTTVGLTSAATILVGTRLQNERLLGDAAGALGYVANWRFLRLGITYGETSADQSPLLHFWSLAIEEQFYVLFPLVAIGALVWGRRHRFAVPAVLGLGIVVSLLMGSTSADTADLYFRSDVRMAELFVGALAGWWWIRRRDGFGDGTRRFLRGIGLPLLAVALALIATSEHHDRLWYRGGLVAYAIGTVGIVFSAVEPGSPLRRVLSVRPLVAIGVRSYAGYLVHWPVFLWLRTATDLGGPARLVVGLAVTVVVAEALGRWIEDPVRRGGRLRAPALVGVGAALASVALLVAAVAPRLALDDDGNAVQQAEDGLAGHLTTWAAPAGTAPEVGIFGDSTALLTTVALARIDDTDARFRVGSGFAELGCTPSAPATFLVEGRPTGSNPACEDWLDAWRVAVRERHVDVAFVQFGPWEVKELAVDGDDYRTILDPEQEAFLEDRLDAGLGILADAVPLVVVATSPRIEAGRGAGRSPSRADPDSDPARMAKVNEVIRRVAARHAGVVVVDLAATVEADDAGGELRLDGIHLEEPAARDLGLVVVDTLLRLRAERLGEPAPPAARTIPVLPPPGP